MVSVPATIVGKCSILATGVLTTPGHSGSFVRLGLREPRSYYLGRYRFGLGVSTYLGPE